MKCHLCLRDMRHGVYNYYCSTDGCYINMINKNFNSFHLSYKIIGKKYSLVYHKPSLSIFDFNFKRIYHNDKYELDSTIKLENVQEYFRKFVEKYLKVIIFS